MPAAVSCGFDDDRDLRGYASLLGGLAGVPDPRRRRGMRHGAASVLAFAVAAALGARRDRKGRPVPPSLSTFRRVLRRLDGQAVSAAFGAWLSGQAVAGLADAPSLVTALDGKAVRGARTREGKAPTCWPR